MISSTQSMHCAQVSSVIETMFCIRSKFVKSMCLYVDEYMMFLDDSLFSLNDEKSVSIL